MGEFLQASISLINLPFTVLLILVVFYWLSVIIGVLDVELFDFDLDIDMDADVDADADMEVGHSGGFLYTVLNLLNIGEVPFMVVVSIAILAAWSISMMSNYYLNTNMSLLIGTGLLIPNIVVSLIIAGLVTRPLRALFATLEQEETHAKIVGRIGVVTTSEVTRTFGQVEIKTKGSPILVNVRTTDDAVLKKGDYAIIYDEDKEKSVYFVEKHEEID